MIKHIWSVLCQRSVVDRDSNTISMFDMLEELSVGIKTNAPEGTNNRPEGIINVPIQYDIVSFWTKEDENSDSSLQIEFIDPNGKSLQTFNHMLEFKEHKRLRSRIHVVGISITTVGIYTFHVKIKEKDKENFRTIAQLPLDVKIVKEDNQKTKTTN